MPKKAASKARKPAKKVEKPETPEISAEQLAEQPAKKAEKPETPEISAEQLAEQPDPVETEFFDRMIHRGGVHCPECDFYPAACLQKRPDYAAYRCRNRNCRHVWEERT